MHGNLYENNKNKNNLYGMSDIFYIYILWGGEDACVILLGLYVYGLLGGLY